MEEEVDVVLRDGSTAHLRPIRPQDVPALERFHAGQSEESIYLRYFAPMPRLSQRDLHYFTNVDQVDRVAFVCTVGDAIVGIARFDRVDADSAEVAFNVSDAHQGRGLASVLLEHLAAAARTRGVSRFLAEVLPRNRRMLAVFSDAGYDVAHTYEDGVVMLSIDLGLTERSLAVMEAREQRADASSVRALLHPTSIALVGVGRRPGGVGHQLLLDLLAGRYTGDLHVVHPRADEVLGVPVHRDLAAVAEQLGRPIDLVVVALPAPDVLDVVAQAASAGVRGLVVLSAGFAEDGPEGLQRQRELVRRARADGMRVVGPNSWGLVNTDPQVQLNASVLDRLPPAGRFGLFCQSGAMSASVLELARRRGVGVSTFLSAGNRADVSGNDCLQYWEQDEATAVIGLYLESVGNPRKFARLARRIARRKPVIVVKSGGSGFGVPPGQPTPVSRAPRTAVDSLLRQSGCIRVENVFQLVDVAQLLLGQPLPAGERVGVVTNSDALGGLIAEACDSWGLRVSELPRALHPQVEPDAFAAAVQLMTASEQVDAVVCAFVPAVPAPVTPVAGLLQQVAAQTPVALLACFPWRVPDPQHVAAPQHDAAAAPEANGRRLPVYDTGEEAVRALAAAVRYGQWRHREAGRRVDPAGLDPQRARRLVAGLLSGSEQGVVLRPEQLAELLACYGIELWPAVEVADADEAVRAAGELGFPVALKTSAPQLRHRADLGGVRLDIADAAELRADVALLLERLAPIGGGGLVLQGMAPLGVACVLRTAEDPLIGPVVTFGLGGDASDLLGDVAHRIPPLTDTDVADLVRSVQAAPRLFGHRGTRPADVPALEELLARLSCLSDDLPQVAELTLNPVVVGERGLAVLGAEGRLAPATGRPDTGPRHLTDGL